MRKRPLCTAAVAVLILLAAVNIWFESAISNPCTLRRIIPDASQVTVTGQVKRWEEKPDYRIFRKAEFKGKDGFWLNGKPFGQLVGANRHQDFAYVGNALPNSQQWRDAKRLRDAGCTIIRVAHYPQDPAFPEHGDSRRQANCKAIVGHLSHCYVFILETSRT